MHATTTDREVSQFFRECYIRWAAGQLDPQDDDELNQLTPPGWENWKQVVERMNGYEAHQFRRLYTLLCETAGLSTEEALAVMLRAA